MLFLFIIVTKTIFTRRETKIKESVILKLKSYEVKETDGKIKIPYFDYELLDKEITDFLNEHNNKNMSGNYYHDYNTIYKNIDDKIVLLSNDGSVYDDSSTPSVSENTTVELTEEEKIKLERQNKIYSIQSEINDLKSQLAKTDYIVIKCQEYELAGKDFPDEYDIIKFSEERDSIRKQINELEAKLSEI